MEFGRNEHQESSSSTSNQRQQQSSTSLAHNSNSNNGFVPTASSQSFASNNLRPTTTTTFSETRQVNVNRPEVANGRTGSVSNFSINSGGGILGMRSAPLQIPRKTGSYASSMANSNLKRKYDAMNAIQNVEHTMRTMDSMYDTNFISWIKNPQNVDYIIMRLRPVISEFDVITVAAGLKWIINDWPLEKKERLFDSITAKWDLKLKLSLWREINGDFGAIHPNPIHPNAAVANNANNYMMMMRGTPNCPVSSLSTASDQNHHSTTGSEEESFSIRRRISVNGRSVGTTRMASNSPTTINNNNNNHNHGYFLRSQVSRSSNGTGASTGNILNAERPSRDRSQTSSHSIISSIIRQRVINNYLSQHHPVNQQRNNHDHGQEHNSRLGDARFCGSEIATSRNDLGHNNNGGDNSRLQSRPTSSFRPLLPFRPTFIVQQDTRMANPNSIRIQHPPITCCQEQAINRHAGDQMRALQISRLNTTVSRSETNSPIARLMSRNTVNGGRVAGSMDSHPGSMATSNPRLTGISSVNNNLIRSPSLDDVSSSGRRISMESDILLTPPPTNTEIMYQHQHPAEIGSSSSSGNGNGTGGHSILKHSASSMEFSPLLTNSGSILLTQSEIDSLTVVTAEASHQVPNSSGNTMTTTTTLTMTATIPNNNGREENGSSTQDTLMTTTRSLEISQRGEIVVNDGNDTNNHPTPIQLAGFCRALRPSI